MVARQTIAGIILAIGFLFLISGYGNVAGFCGFMALFIALDSEQNDHHTHPPTD